MLSFLTTTGNSNPTFSLISKRFTAHLQRPEPNGHILNVIVEWLALLLRIWDVPGSKPEVLRGFL
jgi:hypothetical protein